MTLRERLEDLKSSCSLVSGTQKSEDDVVYIKNDFLPVSQIQHDVTLEQTSRSEVKRSVDVPSGTQTSFYNTS